MALYPHIVDGIKSTSCGLPNGSQFVNLHLMSEEPAYAEIGRRLEAIRVAFSDLNQREWAEKHGFGVSTYNNWVKGIRRIPVENAERLSDLYGADVFLAWAVVIGVGSIIALVEVGFETAFWGLLAAGALLWHRVDVKDRRNKMLEESFALQDELKRLRESAGR